MGKTAEDINETPEEEAVRLEAEEAATIKAEEDAEAKRLEDEEALRLKEEAEAEKRETLEAEGKTPEEIDEILATEGDELEIVREGSQPEADKTVGIRKRINKLNTKVAIATEGEATANTELALEKEKNTLLALALEQAKGNGKAPEMPNPDDFDQGTSDPGFISKQTEYHKSVVTAEVARQVAEATQITVDHSDQNVKNRDLEQKQTKHYERATDIGAKDYEETEDIAIEALGGNQIVNQIIDNFDDSHILLYYLGKNVGEAEKIAGLIKSNPVKGVAALGRLSAELKVKPKKTKIAPDPDKDLQGGAGAAKGRGPKGATFE